MIHDPANAAAAAPPSDTRLRGLLGSMSVFMMIMTVPQVLAIYGLVIKQRWFRGGRRFSTVRQDVKGSVPVIVTVFPRTVRAIEHTLILLKDGTMLAARMTFGETRKRARL
jgi:hypothetical protein